jgi:transcription-repair coupling factor (superfamily II helicase)
VSETQTVEQREKKKTRKPHYPTIDVRNIDEAGLRPEERELVYASREQLLIRMKQLEAVKQYRDQQDLLKADMEKFHTNSWTKNFASRELKMKDDLSNLIKATLSDETITSAKGKETERKHRKILGGLYHSDHEVTTEIEIHRGDSQ